jgi:hypothetical protein
MAAARISVPIKLFALGVASLSVLDSVAEPDDADDDQSTVDRGEKAIEAADGANATTAVSLLMRAATRAAKGNILSDGMVEEEYRKTKL